MYDAHRLTVTSNYKCLRRTRPLSSCTPQNSNKQPSTPATKLYVNLKTSHTNQRIPQKPILRQPHTSAREKTWEVVKRLHFVGDKTKLSNCRRELVNAYTTKPTAKAKSSQKIKRLHFDGDKTKLSNCRRWAFS